MLAKTADDLYELTQQLSANERLRLVEKITKGLIDSLDPAQPVPSIPPVSGIRARVQIVGQVTDIAVDPIRFTIRTARGDLRILASSGLRDIVGGAWGREIIADVDAILDLEGQILEASAISLDLVAEPDDLLSNFESTFGSGSDLWGTAAARREMAALRGGGA